MTNSPAAKLVSQGTKIYSPSSIQLQPNPITPTNSIQVPPNISSNRLLSTGIRYRHDLFLLLSTYVGFNMYANFDTLSPKAG